MGLGFPYVTVALDWRAFSLYNLANILREDCEAIKSRDPNHPVLCHPILSMIPLSYSVASGVDDWLIARSVDILGTSFYPTIPTGRGPLKPETDGWIWAEVLDALRCASGEKPLYIAELQTHYRSRYHPLDSLSPDQLSLLCWMCIAHGAKGITMWKWRPFLRGLQLSGRGLTLHNGTPTERAEAAKKVATVLKKYSELFLNMKPIRPEAAILYNPMVYLKLLYVADRPEAVEYAISDINGFYKALWKSHIPVDFLRPEDIIEGRLSLYKILYMPFTICLDRKAAEKIMEFIEKGGVVVADSPCVVTDDFEIECYKVMPGAGLDKLFKCRELDLYVGLDVAPSRTIHSDKTITGSGITIHVTASHPALPTIEPSSTLSGSLYKEKLDVLPGGEILGVFEDDSPAIIVSSHGGGGSTFIGTCLGRSFFKYNEENTRRLISGFASWAGVVRPVEVLEIHGGGPLDLTLHNYDGGKILFAINLGGKRAPSKLGVRLPKNRYSCSSLIDATEIPIRYENDILAIKADIPPLATKIYYLKME